MSAIAVTMVTLVLIFGSAVMIVGILAYAIVRIITGRHGVRAMAAEESRLVQEIHQSLIRMEQRVESLETLLYDRMEGERRHDR